MGRKKRAIEKRDTTPPPKIEVLIEPLSAVYPAGRLLIASPLTIQAVVQTVPKGNVITMSALRNKLALDHDADYTCPMTTGIFLRIIAEAADEENRQDVPWWRVVRDNGQLIDKLPGGPTRQGSILEKERVDLLHKYKVPRVAPLEEYSYVPQ